MDKSVLKLLLDIKAYETMKEAETIEEKQLIALLFIRNRLKTISNWITFFAVIAILSFFINLFL